MRKDIFITYESLLKKKIEMINFTKFELFKVFKPYISILKKTNIFNNKVILSLDKQVLI